MTERLLTGGRLACGGKDRERGSTGAVPQLAVEGDDGHGLADRVLPEDRGGEVNGVVPPHGVRPREGVGFRHEGFGELVCSLLRFLA